MPRLSDWKYELYNEDCFDTFQRIPDQFVDLVLVDPPYGTTNCNWDSVIPLGAMWENIERIVKPNAAIVFTSAQPFTSVLICSQIKLFRHRWVWIRGERKTGHYDVKRRPLRTFEDVSCFGLETVTYFPQMTEGKAYTATSGRPTIYGKGQNERIIHKSVTTRFPTDVLNFNPDDPRQRVHPTQKPVALMQYLAKTYSNEGDVVLDFAMGSGTTGVACGNLNRRFIGCDNDTEHGYFKIAQERIREAYATAQATV